MRRGTVNPRSWDAAIRAVRKHLLELASRVVVQTEGFRMMAVVGVTSARSVTMIS